MGTKRARWVYDSDTTCTSSIYRYMLLVLVKVYMCYKYRIPILIAHIHFDHISPMCAPMCAHRCSGSVQPYQHMCVYSLYKPI